LTGTLLTDVVGIENLIRFGGRFRAQVWPGDSLTARLELVGEHPDGSVDLAMRTVNQNGVEVFSASATARILPSLS
jgi:acyl dehydratase